MDARAHAKRKWDLNEDHDKISLSSLSQSLIGLSNQALSYRKEAGGDDYLHKFYENHLTQTEIKNPEHPDFEHAHLNEPATVRMARDYVKAWTIFDKEVDQLEPRIINLINQSKNDLEGQLHALHALSACKIEAPETRDQIFNRLIKRFNNNNDKPPRT